MHRFLPLFLTTVTASAAGEVSYAYHVRPILSDKCFACHGPDAAKREAGLRLDTAEGALGPLKDAPGSAIVPGDPEASVAWQRIVSEDPETAMPPPKSHLTLGEEEREILRRWIEQGAVYQPHWAFQPLPDAVSAPEVEDGAWPRGEIDRFVLAALEREGLSPSPAADGLRWLRRVTLDLTGLPPTPEEVEDFQRSPDRAAAVERLLESPRFGEHLAVAWLDAARYADSYGYQSDALTAFWPWRDWVVRSLNANLPIDRFFTWQLAGDLLPGATRDQVLATTFNRLHRLTNEGGSVAEEFLVENMADRVQTFGSVFLALTLECSRCHDHKYDPIPARDYYSLGAFFQSIPERGFYSAATIQPSPTMLLPTPEQERRIAEAKQAVAAAEAAVEARRAACAPDFDAWRSGRGELPAAEPVFHERIGRTLDGDAGIPLPGQLEGDQSEPFTVELEFRDTAGDPAEVVVLHRSFGTDVGYNGIELLLAGGRLEARLVRDWPGNAIGIATGPVAPRGEKVRLTWTYDGSGRAGGLKLYLDGRRVDAVVTADALWKSIATQTHGDGQATVGARFRGRGFRGGEIGRVAIHRRELQAEEISPTGEDAAVREAWLHAEDPAFREALGALREARAGLIAVEGGVFELPVMRELAQPRPAHLLARGAYDAPRTRENEVGRDTFSEILPPFPADAPRDRLGLAMWLTDPSHPLTARVFVNRIWANFFGAGIVETSDNFGLQGSLPSHPELLDWLARDFVSHGWDLKRLCRQIALSATYAQDSRRTEPLCERDPANRLLARGPSRRLSAEQLRDHALAASGLLRHREGGPPVSPYQPGGDLRTESNSMSPPYRRSSGDDLHRRSLYSVWKRTAPLPNQLTFDSPTREVCTIRRPQTSTPLQALVLLNDVQFTESARALAAKVHALPEGERLDAAFVACASRPPTERERRLLSDLLAGQLAVFREKPEDARAFLSLGDDPAGRDLDPAEAAAWTVACQAILNLDASVWNR